MDRDLFFSSKTDNWLTPKALFDVLNSKYNFTLDPASSDLNHLCNKYFTIHDDGLSKSWSGERVFCNPPYSRLIGKWIEKAFDEVFYNDCECVVLLLPARVDTSWFHDYCLPYAKYIRFIKGRLKFSHNPNSAPFPSMIVVFSLYNSPNLFDLDIDHKLVRGYSL